MPEKKRPTYSSAFKSEAVELVFQETDSLAGVAKRLGISESALRQWVKKARKTGKLAKVSDPLEEELRTVKKELERTRQERDIIKKTLGYFASPNR